MTKPRLAVVVSHPTQYYSPWFRWMAREEKLDLCVFYLWDFGTTAKIDPQFRTAIKWDVDLLSGYPYEFVRNAARRPGSDHFSGLRNPELPQRLRAYRPSGVLLFGYRSPSQLSSLFWARRRRVPVLFRGDSHLLGRGRLSLAKRLLLHFLYRQCSAFLTVGHANAEYFLSLGVPRSKLFHAPHAVDASLFDPRSENHRARAADLRARLGLSEGTRVVLFAGKLVPAKQPRELLEAYLAQRQMNTALVFVGEGSEKAHLQQSVRDANAADVHFLPFANQSEMPACYLLADVFVLPSRGFYETWGLAVNESMHMGTPALVSTLVGCQRDLVTDGETGWVFSPGYPFALAEKLAEALITTSDPARKMEIREKVSTRIARYTYRQTTAGLLTALAAVSESSSPVHG